MLKNNVHMRFEFKLRRVMMYINGTGRAQSQGKVTTAVVRAAWTTANAQLVQHIINIQTMSATISSEEKMF